MNDRGNRNLSGLVSPISHWCDARIPQVYDPHRANGGLPLGLPEDVRDATLEILESAIDYLEGLSPLDRRAVLAEVIPRLRELDDRLALLADSEEVTQEIEIPRTLRQPDPADLE